MPIAFDVDTHARRGTVVDDIGHGLGGDRVGGDLGGGGQLTHVVELHHTFDHPEPVDELTQRLSETELVEDRRSQSM